jgi:hemerythrin-like domain-containing protein
MQPRGPLMIEHRLIEKMISLIGELVDMAESNRNIDPLSIDKAVDFIRTYADMTHHGKEEDILFRDLEAKNMSSADAKIMEELIEEHKYGRKTVGELVDAKVKYVNGSDEALDTIIEKLKAIVAFYPPHIAKEDKVFFPSSMNYFSEKEKEGMLGEFWEFDREVIHNKYQLVAEEIKGMISNKAL